MCVMTLYGTPPSVNMYGKAEIVVYQQSAYGIEHTQNLAVIAEFH